MIQQDLMKRAVVFACDFRPRIVGGVSVMPNHGQAAGAPTWLTLGDGTTTTTFPTPLAGWGASFDGGDYVNTGVVDRYEITNQFSFYVYCSMPKSIRFNTLFQNTSVSNGFTLRRDDVIALRFFNFNRFWYGVGAANSNSIASVYNGTNTTDSVSHYSNGIKVSNTYSASTPGITFKTGVSIKIGLNTVSAYNFLGTGYAFGIFDGLLTPRDINFLDFLVKSNIK